MDNKYWFVLALIIIVTIGASWIVTCGVIKLITMCFGWNFTWEVATGIWLILFLISGTFNKN